MNPFAKRRLRGEQAFEEHKDPREPRGMPAPPPGDIPQVVLERSAATQDEPFDLVLARDNDRAVLRLVDVKARRNMARVLTLDDCVAVAALLIDLAEAAGMKDVATQVARARSSPTQAPLNNPTSATMPAPGGETP